MNVYLLSFKTASHLGEKGTVTAWVAELHGSGLAEDPL